MSQTLTGVRLTAATS